jgi:hypothetical protein
MFIDACAYIPMFILLMAYFTAGGSYAFRGRTNDGCDTQHYSSGWSLWYPIRSTYILLPKCRGRDSGQVATESRWCHQASTTTQYCRDPCWRGSAAPAACGSSTARRGVMGRCWFPRAMSWPPSPQSIMPSKDWPRGSATQSTTWCSDSCTPDENHTATYAVVPHRSRRCVVRCRKFYCEGSENGRRAHPSWSGWWSG